LFEEPKYVQTKFNIIIPRQPEIRRKAFEFEDILVDKYFQPEVVNIPDELDPQLPRLFYQS